MAYKTKVECENEFVKYILSVGGVKVYGCTYEKRNWYWFFDLTNGERRYWKNLSDESQKTLGIYNAESKDDFIRTDIIGYC